MAMTNDPSKDELTGYLKKTLTTAAVLLGVIVLSLGAVKVFDYPALIAPLYGGLCGVIVATLNLLAIGYAFFIIAIEKGRKVALVWPVLSFVVICILAYIFATMVPSMILGFALGLTTPIIFGAVVVFLG